MARGPMGGPGGPGRRGPGGGGGPMGSRLTGEKPKDMKKTLRRLIQYIGSSKNLLFALIGIMLVITLMNLIAPVIQAKAIDTITLTDKKLHVDFHQLIGYLAMMLAVYAGNSGLSYFQSIMAARLSQTTVRTMRKDLFQKISHLPISYIDSHQHGDIMSRMTNDVENVSNTISTSIASLFSGIVTIIGCLVIMFYYNPLLTLFCVLSIPISVILSSVVVKPARKYFSAQQRLLGALNGQVEEMVTGCKTVIAYGKEKDAIEEFARIGKEYRDTSIKARILGGLMGPVMNLIGNFTYLLIAAVGGWLTIEGVITVGIIQAFLSYSRQFSRPINEIANQYTLIQTAIAGAERVFEIMDYEVETDEGAEHIEPEQIKGDLDFENVVFSYKAGEPVLKGFDLEVTPGQKIAIVGATGSGKTTVVNLLMRFYDPDSGVIRLDGIDINNIPKNELRHTIAIVLQDTILFSDTIRANIGYGKLGATDEEIEAAAQMANADLFISQLPQGYDTVLSESGSNLSQGQRQLLSIARAVLADPKILILDEATSSVDTRTEMNIQKAMIALMKGRTSLIIAHRLSTIRDADKIIVVADGRICESGNHEELLAQKGHYYSLYQNQFAGKEI